ncbi:MAG: DUF169 domain-containing protein [Acidobacteriota bacterium]
MITDYAALERTLTDTLGLMPPVAVAYLDSAPAGVAKFAGTMPSGCSFWGLARGSEGFYTVPSDHLNCPIGSYTHRIDLPPERAADLGQTLSLMAGIGYIRMEEVASIPRLSQTPAVIYYAPLSKTAVEPDVVMVAGRPGALMRLQEAATRAGAAAPLPLLGRPTCMALPAALLHGAVMSSGCIGNRVYTGLGEDELYLMVPGRRLGEIVEQLATIEAANTTLASYHQERRMTLTRTS